MLLSPSGIDRSITDAVVGARTDIATTIAQVITTTGNALFLTVVVVVAVVAFVARRAYAEAVLIGAGALVGQVLMVGLKNLVARPRPPVADRLIDIDTFSFPSGHAMMSMVVYCLLGATLYRTVSWVRAHPAVLVIAPLWSVAIGCTRVYLGVHWTTDVVAGWLIGGAWVALCLWLCRRWAPVATGAHPAARARR
ncbi:phosphatase PAP2 family protein [Gordonia sp. OPL2]|uniref:phosphatase PAP2 family protein n=1 Tax=Gordonia sp. OPL2 TaxID=2486274 RepID=UPI001655C4F3|nr:phosphatase PAP2 family protein [Gordonia sp. OPL2]